MIAHLSAIIEEEQYHCKVISNDTIKIHYSTLSNNSRTKEAKP
jgi:hypothetical protein